MLAHRLLSSTTPEYDESLGGLGGLQPLSFALQVMLDIKNEMDIDFLVLSWQFECNTFISESTVLINLEEFQFDSILSQLIAIHGIHFDGFSPSSWWLNSKFVVNSGLRRSWTSLIYHPSKLLPSCVDLELLPSWSVK
jgi:hypothetical protein